MTDNGVELVWEGKRREVERVALPFQRVEVINESRATRQVAPLFAAGAADGAGEGDGWRNKLIWGDNKYVLASLQSYHARKQPKLELDSGLHTYAEAGTKHTCCSLATIRRRCWPDGRSGR
ncbi:MAG: hypothetical protein ACYDEB_07390 [Dehalococcoidia bacterium]